MDHMNKLFMHASQDHLFHHTKLFFLTQNMCLANNQDPAVSQFAQFQLDLGSGNNCLLMEISRYPLTSSSMAPPFSHSSSTYTHLSSPILLLSLHTSSITCSLPQGMRMYMSSTTTLLTCSMHHQLKPGFINQLILPS